MQGEITYFDLFLSYLDNNVYILGVVLDLLHRNWLLLLLLLLLLL